MATLVNNNVMSMFNGQLKSNDNNMHAHTGKYLRIYVCLCVYVNYMWTAEKLP